MNGPRDDEASSIVAYALDALLKAAAAPDLEELGKKCKPGSMTDPASLLEKAESHEISVEECTKLLSELHLKRRLTKRYWAGGQDAIPAQQTKEK